MQFLYWTHNWQNSSSIAKNILDKLPCKPTLDVFTLHVHLCFSFASIPKESKLRIQKIKSDVLHFLLLCGYQSDGSDWVTVLLESS